MRTQRKRAWAELAVNMTPLIDVVFLIIIFFIIMINFSERHLRNVLLPNADEAEKSLVDKRSKIPITIKSNDLIFLDHAQVSLSDITDQLNASMGDKEQATIQIRADGSIPYKTIKEVMKKVAELDISNIEFSAYQDEPKPLEEE